MGKAIILFNNGLEIEADTNGNCFITDNKPSFPWDLSYITVNYTGEEQIYKNVKIIECASVDGRYWFSFYEQSQEELNQKKIANMIADQQANIDYLSMMTGIDL